MSTALALQLPTAPIAQLANLVRRDWKNISPYAVPYLRAMGQLSSVDDNYLADDGRSIVLYFLANAGAWRGETARLVKAELKRRVGV